MFRHGYCLASVLPLLLFAPQALAQPAATPVSVSLELVTEKGFAVDGQLGWLEALKSLGLTNVRIRAQRPGDELAITNRGTDDSPRYAVTGLLTSDNKLQLPGLTVGLGQRKQLADWLTRLREGGEDVVSGASGAFGLSAKQFVVLHDAVKQPVTIATKGKPVRDVVKRIVESTPVTIELDAAAQTALASNERVLDELKGLSRGTALAAAVRPLGLVVVVTGQGKRAGGLRIGKPTGKEEAWPIGVAPSATNHADQTPKSLLKFVNVEINERPLAEALAALEERIDIPVLFDHNALAQHEVDLNTKVSFPERKTFYKKIIDELLFQVLLRSELRLDDADRPFLWISTIKK